VVRRVEADYIAPAVFDDRLEVETMVTQMTPARMVMRQSILRGEAMIFRADVTIVCIGMGGKPVRLPAALRLIPVTSGL